MSTESMSAAAGAAAAERLHQLRLEEETMTDYAHKDLDGWQFKIVRGSFRTAEQIQALQAEQAQYGWSLVEVFDQERIRFKRPGSEAAKDSERFGNPYDTGSLCGGMSPERKLAVILLSFFLCTFIVFTCFLLTKTR